MRRSWWTLSQFDWSLYKGRSFRPQRAAHVRGVRVGGGEDSEKACVCRLGREASEETNSGIAVRLELFVLDCLLELDCTLWRGASVGRF